MAEQAGKILHMLDAVPQHADGGAGRGDRPGLGHPRRQGLLHDVGHRGERHGAAAGQLVPPEQPDPGDAQQLPRPVVLHDRDHREPELVTDLALAVPDLLRARRQPLPQPVRGPGGRRVRRRVRRGPARGPRPGGRRRRGADRRADPGGRRVHPRARRAARRVRQGAGRARHPVDQRRGADGLGPHRRALLGLAGARPGRRDPGHRHVRQGHRERPVGGRGHRARRDHGQPPRQLDLDVRRLADHRGRGAGQPAVPARARPAGQRREGRPDPARRAA